MDRSIRQKLLPFYQMLLGLGFFGGTLSSSMGALALILWGVVQCLGTVPWYVWLALSPLLYISWLNLFLIACVIDVQFWCRCLGYKKPRRAQLGEELGLRTPFFLTHALYLRLFGISSLPLVNAFLAIPGLRRLVLTAYAPTAHLGRRSQIYGMIYDPDLTYIGDGVVIGGGSVLSAHSIRTNSDGHFVLATAPIEIGSRAVIGGDSRIALGARIGADAIIEAGSNLAPFAVVGAGETWGGNPARRLRSRFEVSRPPGELSIARATTELATEDEQSLRRVVATALCLPLEAIVGDLGTVNCAAWDSLGQMGIAAGLYATFGLAVSADDSFGLRSLADLRGWLQRNRDAEAGVPKANQTTSQRGFELPADPELLPLYDHDQVTRALANTSRDCQISESRRAPIRVVVAATFTAEPLAQSLKLWSRAFGIAIDLRFAGFNQVHQCLISPDSEFHRNSTGLNLVLTRPEDLLAADRTVSVEAVEALLSAITSFAASSPGTLVVGTLPPIVSTFLSVSRESVESLRNNWRSRIAALSGVRLLEFDELVERIGVADASQADLEVRARSPYSARVFQALGIATTRLLRKQSLAPAKVLALDADGVLWGGILAEDGLAGIQLGADYPGRAYQLFQQQVLELKRRGVLLVLVSRNAAEDVWQVLDEHPGMKIRRSDIAAARINWEPKSQNLESLARELNLGLDSFVFIDDDPANRAEVAANAPGVTVLPLPVEPELYCQALGLLWRFDNPHVTREDLARPAMMAAEQQRRQQLESTTELASYLLSLQLQLAIRPALEQDLPRVAQLTQKTNQFNLSLKRQSLAEIRSLGKNHSVYVVEAVDRFGDYGMIGAAILVRDSADPTIFELDTLLLSCRIMGRHVEDAVLHWLCATVSAAGGQTLRAHFVPGPRNQPCRDFLVRSCAEPDRDQFEVDAAVGHPLPGHIEWSSRKGTSDRAAA